VKQTTNFSIRQLLRRRIGFGLTVFSAIGIALTSPSAAMSEATTGGITTFSMLPLNKAVPELTVQNTSVNESDGSASVVVRLSTASVDIVSATVFTRPATARGGSDYIGDTQSIVFQPGETEQSFSFLLIDDLTREPTDFDCGRTHHD